MAFAPRYLRLVVSYLAAAISAAVYTSQDTPHVDALAPTTWANALGTRYGQVMAFCVCWMVLEFLIGLAFPREGSAQTAMPAH